jgi:hypothetical protein
MVNFSVALDLKPASTDVNLIKVRRCRLTL